MLCCPVCGSTFVRVWVHSRFHDTSCNDCGSTWQQVGAEQWGIRPAKERLEKVLAVSQRRGA